MVVQIVIENQFQRLINGFALGPPIRTLANPDLQNTVQQIARQSMTEKKAQTLKSHPNWSRTHVFAMVTVVENFPGTSSPSCIWSGLQKFIKNDINFNAKTCISPCASYAYLA